MQSLVERVPLDRFMPFVMAAAQGLPESMAQAYVRQACIDFSTRSGILKRAVTFNLQPCVFEYPLFSPEDGEQIVRVSEVRVGRAEYRGHRDRIVFFHFGRRFTVSDGMLHLSHAPSEHEKPIPVEVRLRVSPTQDACDVDALLYDDWQQAIEDGALARIYQLPGYQFTALPLATQRGRSFDEQIVRARVRAVRADTSAELNALAPPII